MSDKVATADILRKLFRDIPADEREANGEVCGTWLRCWPRGGLRGFC